MKAADRTAILMTMAYIVALGSKDRRTKIGAVIVTNTRRVRFLLSSSHPDQELFWLVARKLAG